jgi:hypothetical protein
VQQYLEQVAFDPDSGIIPKTVNFVFNQLVKSNVTNMTVSFIQVYNEKVFDLLNTEQINNS